jgi:hypothetical protein
MAGDVCMSEHTLSGEIKRLREAILVCEERQTKKISNPPVTASECIDLLKWLYEYQSNGGKPNEWLLKNIASPAEERLAYLLKESAK